MEVCSSCPKFNSCNESRYSMDFIRRLMIVSSVISENIMYITHKDEAEELGYDLEKMIEFIKKNQGDCFFFSNSEFHSTDINLSYTNPH